MRHIGAQALQSLLRRHFQLPSSQSINLRPQATEHIHAPFTAAPAVLEGAGVRLGQDYPLPIVDLDHARKAALRVYEKIRGIKHSTRGHELEHARD